MRRRHLLVSEDDGAERVEVWSDDVLEEVHELDAARRVVRSLYRSPRADGAVEVRYERAEGGSVASVVRMDSEGQVIRG